MSGENLPWAVFRLAALHDRNSDDLMLGSTRGRYPPPPPSTALSSSGKDARADTLKSVWSESPVKRRGRSPAKAVVDGGDTVSTTVRMRKTRSGVAHRNGTADLNVNDNEQETALRLAA